MKVFAHRGASGNFPENTLSAIQGALVSQADGIEIDIQSCKDDFVVLHDIWLDRTTSGDGKVSDYTAAELAQFDAGQGEAIPSLQQVFDLVGTRLEINLELKTVPNIEGFIDLILRNLDDQTIRIEQLLISSFNHPLLKRVKELLPAARIGALTASIPLEYAKFAQDLNAFSLHVDREFINTDFVNDAKQRGLKVYAYTVDKQKDIEHLKSLGVDGIFSNYPCQAKIFLST
ncbi:glycerophosphodiester phosphodiesterase [Pseudoalteromonas xiamenensis]|uniref:Glycerophosphodiester phosphodiesterase n=1 Tax=Pseudoalteromonas xiamenensis TaxID=882626 RepID=A0A975DEL5_9GAMM|nr:glycerophosphodiester phosphodiesterase family protein [Pseudoalteromonas xiamenensis]QTH70154.1 glycerophosphodiester phosphodiesterase [Pseudoalteromonas xiamenensis]